MTRHKGLRLLSYGGQTDDGRWLFMLIGDDGRGDWAVADTDGEAKTTVCDRLGLDKAKVLGGSWVQRSD